MGMAEGLRGALGGWERKEFWNLAAVAWAAAMVVGAQILEYGLGQTPCALCVTQRLFAALAGLIAAAGLAHGPRLGIYPLMALLAAIAGGGFAIRHLYLISLPADQVPGCGVDLDYLIEVFPLGEVLRAMTSGTGECADQSFKIPALALAGFVGMAAIAIAYWAMPASRGGGAGRGR